MKHLEKYKARRWFNETIVEVKKRLLPIVRPSDRFILWLRGKLWNFYLEIPDLGKWVKDGFAEKQKRPIRVFALVVFLFFVLKLINEIQRFLILWNN